MGQKIAFVLLAATTLWAFGAYIAARSGDGAPEYYPQNFSEEQLKASHEFLRSLAVACLDSPLQNAYVLKTRLVGFEAAPATTLFAQQSGGASNAMALSRPEASFVYRYRFNAAFQKYTYFGIPIGRIKIVNSENVLC